MLWVTAVTGKRQVLQIRWQDRFFGLRAKVVIHETDDPVARYNRRRFFRRIDYCNVSAHHCLQGDLIDYSLTLITCVKLKAVRRQLRRVVSFASELCEFSSATLLQAEEPQRYNV